MDIISIGNCNMMGVCINCSDDINAQQPHIATCLPPDPFLQNEAHYLSMVGRGRAVESILFLLYVGWTENIFS